MGPESLPHRRSRSGTFQFLASLQSLDRIWILTVDDPYQYRIHRRDRKKWDTDIKLWDIDSNNMPTSHTEGKRPCLKECFERVADCPITYPITQRWVKKWSLGCKNFLLCFGWLWFSKTGPLFWPISVQSSEIRFVRGLVKFVPAVV